MVKYGQHDSECLAESRYTGKWDSSDPEAMAALNAWLADKVCNCGFDRYILTESSETPASAGRKET